MAIHDCLLINPQSAGYSKTQKMAPYLPAGLLSIASVLKSKGLHPFVIDMVAENSPEESLASYFGGNPGRVLLIGFTVMTVQIRHAAELSAYIRGKYPGTKIIWGGIHPSLFPEEVLRQGFVDFVCAGEGEYVAYELMMTLKVGADPRSVLGLYFLSDRQVVFTGRRTPNDLNALPFLDYSLIDYRNYKERTVFRGRETKQVNAGVLVSSMGCPYRCTFCVNSNKRLAFGGYRSKSAGRLADEIEFMIKEFGVDYFDFLDENFFVKREHPESFSREIERRGLKFSWFTNMRADAFSRGLVDDGLLERLRGVGLYLLSIGAESGSQRVLDKLKKDITVEQIMQSAQRIVKHGLGATYSFMMGIPGETEIEVKATMRLIQRLRSLDPKISIVGPQVFRPYPGGDLYDECVTKYGYTPPKDISKWAGSVDLLTGFEDIEKLSWIGDKDFIRKVSFYLEFANINIDALRFGPLKRAVFLFLKGAADFRIRYQFWALNLDMRLIMWYKMRR